MTEPTVSAEDAYRNAGWCLHLHLRGRPKRHIRECQAVPRGNVVDVYDKAYIVYVVREHRVPIFEPIRCKCVALCQKLVPHGPELLRFVERLVIGGNL